MVALTHRQSEALDFIKHFHAAHGVCPTVSEIAGGVGLKSKSNVVFLLRGLEERGAIRRIPNRARAIEIVRDETAEFHLKAILNEVERYGSAFADSRCVVAAMRFMGRGTS